MVSMKHQETQKFYKSFKERKKNLPDELYCCVDK